MATTQIKFDIILPTVHRDSLEKAIDSVRKQDYPYWHLWVIFDCGVMAGSFEDNISLCFRTDDGISHDDSGAWARNEGVRLGTNPWIAYIDDDDEWHTNHLSTLSSLLQAKPEATMLRTAGRSFSLRRKSPRSKARVRRLGAVNSTDILTVGMAHTRELFNLTSGWKPQDNHDKLLWQEMLSLGGVPATTDQVTFEFQR